MSDDLPLVLWDCQFREADVKWRQDAAPASRIKAYADMHLHTSSLDLKSRISQHFLRAYRELGEKAHGNLVSTANPDRSGTVQVGAGRVIGTSRYTPLLQRPRAELVEVINQRWMDGQGKRRAERKAAAAAEAGVEGD
jgi:tRNA pseudouridine38/39 synthase